MSAQPQWRFLANLGDASPIDHGGAFVFTDETGVYDPEMEMLENEDEDSCEGPWNVHRFSLDKCTYVDGVLSDNAFHPEYPAWFASELESVASAVGGDADMIRAFLCSDDVLKRASAYLTLYECLGSENFDEYPITFTDREEIETRYADCNI